MNEGENSGMPNGPIFSSPNISGGEPSKQEAVPMPEEQVDITKVADPTVATTIASMPDAPEKPIVTSGGDPVDKKKPRFGLGTRRFKEKSQKPAAPIMQAAQTPAFANAPEFFNDAVGDIVLADAADAEKKNKTKKFLIIGILAVVVLAIAGVGIAMLLKGSTESPQNKLARFMNLYYYGNDDASNMPKKDAVADVEPYFMTNKKNAEYVKKVEAAFNDYYSVADDKAKSSELYMTMQRYIYFASDTASLQVLPFQVVAQKVFYEGGYEAAVKFINSHYSPAENEREMGKSYREWLVKAALEYASQANIYKDSGCKFVNWSIDYSCQKNITGDTASMLKASVSAASLYTQKSERLASDAYNYIRTNAPQYLELK